MGDILKQITIPTPCHANWDAMTGDNRTRFCQECGKSVVNLAALTEEEATSLVEQGDDLCAQVTRRKDGTVVTKSTTYRIRSLMMVIAWVAGALGLFRFINQFTIDDGKSPGSPSRSEREALSRSLRVSTDNEMIMGKMIYRGRPGSQTPPQAP
jgi:hypothetical protein